MYIRESIGPKTDPWGTLEVCLAGYCLNFSLSLIQIIFEKYSTRVE